MLSSSERVVHCKICGREVGEAEANVYNLAAVVHTNCLPDDKLLDYSPIFSVGKRTFKVSLVSVLDTNLDLSPLKKG